MMQHIEEHDLIVPEQFGFRRGHSTTHQQVRVENDTHRNTALSNNTVMVLLDGEKAFDNVWHDGLVYKLVQTGFSTYLTRMVRNYLANRSFRVHFTGTESELQAIPAGVLQSSLLGSILYNLYTSNFPPLPVGAY
ncbi:hypothetical protein RP20_CCG004565 [Aedes albopictus]|nr:hypothetical protein RP20_CCG004565 [Aedes albopictus]